jgi:hypothetical protein
MLSDTTYTQEMFRRDQEEINSKLTVSNLQIKNAENTSHPLLSFEDILNIFVTKYGNSRGSDYCTRFFSILRFIDHYNKELLQQGLLSEEKPGTIQVSSELIEVLLGSFKAPQPPRKLSSSPLMNQDHEFNYPKVIKALKPGPKQA